MYDYSDATTTCRDFGETRGSKYAISREVGPCLYAVRTPDGLIKIGFSQNVMDRLRYYGRRATVLAVRPGSYEEEQAMHRRLKPYRAKAHEYYHPVPTIIDVVNELRAAVNLDPLPH